VLGSNVLEQVQTTDGHTTVRTGNLLACNRKKKNQWKTILIMQE
jgi:hypothetical protein